MIRSKKAVAEAEAGAARQKALAVECGAAIKDLVLTREVTRGQVKEIRRQASWWEEQFPGTQTHANLVDAFHQLIAQLGELDSRIEDKGKEQQDHEIAAAELEELARAARAEWDEQHKGPRADAVPLLVAIGGRDVARPKMSLVCAAGEHDQCQDHDGGSLVDGCQCPHCCGHPAEQTRDDTEAGT